MKELRRLTSTFIELLLVLLLRDRTQEELEALVSEDIELTTVLHAWKTLEYLADAKLVCITQRGLAFLERLYEAYASGVSLCPICEFPWDYKESRGLCSNLPLTREVPGEQPGDIVFLHYDITAKAHSSAELRYGVVRFFYAQPYHLLNACVPQVHQLCVAFQGEAGNFTIPYDVFCSLKTN